MFLISQVGNSRDATIYLDELDSKESAVGDMVYCSTDKLDELHEKFRLAYSDHGYTAEVGF